MSNNKYKKSKALKFIGIPDEYKRFLPEAIAKMSVGKAGCGLCNKRDLAVMTMAEVPRPRYGDLSLIHPEDRHLDVVQTFVGLCEECFNDNGLVRVKEKMKTKQTMAISLQDYLKNMAEKN